MERVVSWIGRIRIVASSYGRCLRSLGPACALALCVSFAVHPALAAQGAAAPPAAPPVDVDALALGLLSFLVVGGFAIWLGKSTDLLRDSQPVDFAGAKPESGGEYRRPYSLAQSQMTWWFCIVVASFVYIVWIKRSTEGVLTDTSLILMGIGTGTALGAAAIEQMKGSGFVTLTDFNRIRAKIAAIPPGTVAPQADLDQRDALAKQLASENFLRDMLTDVDGISLHRFQSLAWTIVLGAIFVIHVLAYRSFPEFDARVLAILGISAGTYLGFKVPERPA